PATPRRWPRSPPAWPPPRARCRPARLPASRPRSSRRGGEVASALYQHARRHAGASRIPAGRAPRAQLVDIAVELFEDFGRQVAKANPDVTRAVAAQVRDLAGQVHALAV